MSGFRFGIVFIVCAFIFSIANFSSASRSKNWKIKRIEFVPVLCSRTDCWAHQQDGTSHDKPTKEKISHGNIRLVYADNRKVQVTKSATAVGNLGEVTDVTPDPQLSPDRKTVGWTQGRHQKCTDWSAGGTMFVNSQLVLFRDGRVLRVLEAPDTFIENWRFWNNGKYVAIGSRWHHGMGHVRLFEVNSGKLLERWSTPEAQKKKLKWAKGLTP